jgi:hypothetical protein
VRPAVGPMDTGAPSVIPRGYERMRAHQMPAQPRSRTRAERQARSTRPDLWPTFVAPPELLPLPPRDLPDEDLLDVLDFL